jgi:urease accessory protein
MHELTKRITAGTRADVSLTLPFELRQRSRLRVSLDNGEDAGVYLERGTVLRGGDRLEAEDGLVVEIRAAPEPVSTVCCDDPLAVARVCYHLGNRHVALQIGDGWIRYLHDHVLDDLVRGFGLEVLTEQVPFEPEAGAYRGAHAHHHE